MIAAGNLPNALSSAAESLHYRTIYSQGPVGIGVVLLDGTVVDLNPAAWRMLGLAERPALPRPAAEFIHPDDHETFTTAWRRLLTHPTGTLSLDIRFACGGEQPTWGHVTGWLIRTDEGRPSHLVAVVEDVSDRYRLRTRLDEVASRDRLTRLPNRRFAEDVLQRAGACGATTIGLAVLDIDGFRLVNEQHGQRAGDALLVGVAERLRAVAGPDLLARIGGDEFAVLALDPGGTEGMCRLVDRLLAALDAPIQVNDGSIEVAASAGVVVERFRLPNVERCPIELLRAAGTALSWAKAQGGRQRVLFDPERDAGESARRALLGGLRGALDAGQFRLVYQPLVRLADRSVCGAEALVRWQHPEFGLLGPDRFIELAERSGAIVPLGRWVLEQACRDAACWAGPPGAGAPYVSVNVSPVQLPEPGFVEDVVDALTGSGLEPDRLQLEITEQAVLGDEPASTKALAELRAVGVRLALDDFGTGYSSLTWLRRLPVTALKIDGTFIDGLRHDRPDPVDQSIVSSLIEMAHALGLEVTAEWVETELQAERLAGLGCDVGQGRWFGDAGPAEWVPAARPSTIE